MTYTLRFRDLDLSAIPRVGGKNASLGELIRHLAPLGVRVPDGFAITADAYRLHLRQAGLEAEIEAALDRLDVRDVAALAQTARQIRERIRAAPLPAELETEILAAYEQLSRASGEQATDVAVRSSATAEDLPDGVLRRAAGDLPQRPRDAAALLAAVRDCMASLFTDRAIVYRAERGFDHRDVALSVGVQKMVRSDLGSARRDLHARHRERLPRRRRHHRRLGPRRDRRPGRVNPDEFWVHKPTLAQGFPPIIRRELGDKEVKLVYARRAAPGRVVEVRVPRGRSARASCSPTTRCSTLARWAVAIEEHYSARRHRRRWTSSGRRTARRGELFIVQARPETVHAQAAAADARALPAARQGHGARRAARASGAEIGVGARARRSTSPTSCATFQRRRGARRAR